MEARVAVLASGFGSNLQSLLDDPSVGPRIALVVSDRADAKALDRAKAHGVPSEFVDPASHPDREGFDREVLRVLERHRVTHVALAGFMRILSPVLVRAFEGRILNVHPSLLPSFPGAHAPRDALAWGAMVSGVTVHLVDEELDHGPIVSQEAVPVADDDDEQTLHARIQEVEHRIYPAAVRAMIEGRLSVEGRRVRIRGEEGS